MTTHRIIDAVRNLTPEELAFAIVTVTLATHVPDGETPTSEQLWLLGQGRTLLHHAQDHGLEIPEVDWHPAMSTSVLTAEEARRYAGEFLELAGALDHERTAPGVARWYGALARQLIDHAAQRQDEFAAVNQHRHTWGPDAG